jgi:transposase
MSTWAADKEIRSAAGADVALRIVPSATEGAEMDRWMSRSTRAMPVTTTPHGLGFAAGLRKDLAAVRAGLTEEWSNGPVEGFVHKLKLLKRQGYSRADFELLRARMLTA